MAINNLAKEFIKQWEEFGDGSLNYEEMAGNFACKYAENQDEVNEILDQIDEHYGK